MAFPVPPPLLPQNTAAGVAGGDRNPFQIGINDVDAGTVMEGKVSLPWVSDPENSWLDYRCWIETYLDPGIVIHRNLPQTDQDIDQLGTDDVNDTALASRKVGGPNTVSAGSFDDTVQRMANSKYTFVLKGAAVRAGYQPSIPKLVEVAGVPAIPMGIQKVIGPRILGNYSGVPVYFASWELTYSVSVPPTDLVTPPTNLSEHIAAIAPDDLTQGMQVPFSAPDSNSLRSGPQRNIDLNTGLPRGGA